jgi:hypothetical protein
MAVSALGTIPAGSQISPANQRIYQQSNLIGDWKGTWTKNKQAVELNVVSSTAAPRRSSIPTMAIPKEGRQPSPATPLPMAM